MELNHIYKAVNQSKGTVIIIHGMAEHQRRYDAFTQTLNTNQFNTLTLDLPGHGLSIDNDAGHIEGVFPTLLRIHALIKDTPRPHILFGHSMGSLFSRSYYYQFPDDIDLLILSGSPYKPQGFKAIKSFIKVLGTGRKQEPSPFIDKLFNATLSKSIPDRETNVDWLSFDKENIERYINDPLCGFPFTYQGYNTLMDLFELVYNTPHSTHTNTPIMFVTGSHDPCPDHKRNGLNIAIERLQTSTSYPIQSILYNNSRHELLNDVEKEQVTQDILIFIQDHLSI